MISSWLYRDSGWRRPDHGFLLLQNLFAADDAGGRFVPDTGAAVAAASVSASIVSRCPAYQVLHTMCIATLVG